MGRYYWRPNFAAAVDYGNVDTDGSGPVLGDNSDSTRKKYMSDAGSVLTFIPPSPTVIPAGRNIIAVRVGHRQQSFLLYNGWVRSYLRIDGKKQANTVAYKQDGFSGSVREILGVALYNKNLAPWTFDDLATMSAETGSATGEIGPDKNKRWCIANEVFIQLVYNDPVPSPSNIYPANGATVDTSSVQFSAAAPAPQEEQPVQTIFQVCRVNTFDNSDVRTFVGGLNGSVSPTSRSYYVSEPGKDSYTNLGPGVWYVRIKNRDYRGDESAWSSATSFTVAHGPLPVPSLVDPVGSQTVTSPYRNRIGRISAQPSGGRKVGVTWQFSKASDFSTGVIQWTNSADGTFVASADYPYDVSYNPTPNALTTSGLKGGTVGSEDQSQYLSQGIWYGRVRCTDVWDQSGSWSSAISFTVTHPPVPTALVPTGGVSFDTTEAAISWTFSDPWLNDYQTAYQMVIADSSANWIFDTGKVTSSISKAVATISNTYFRQLLTVYVLVWDADDVLSSGFVTGTFRLSKAPITTIVSPSDNQSINSGQPNIVWTNTFAVGTVTQKSFAIVIKEADTGKKVYDTGTIVSSSSTHLPSRPILSNLKGYQMSLTVTDSEDLSKTVTRNFSTNFDHPQVVDCSVDNVPYMENGYVMITWPTGNPDPYFKEWRVYRKKESEPDSALTLAGIVEDPTKLSFKDWLISGNNRFVYTVVQAAYRYGSIVESEYNYSPSFALYADSYWLIIPSKPELNIKLKYVTGDRYTNNREMADYNIIGGGRKRSYGTKYGKSGELSIQVRHNQMMTATEFIAALERVCDNNYSLYMRDPFGNVTVIALGETSVERIPGVGYSEFADVTVPYVEVGKTGSDVVKQDKYVYIEYPVGSGTMVAVMNMSFDNDGVPYIHQVDGDHTYVEYPPGSGTMILVTDIQYDTDGIPYFN